MSFKTLTALLATASLTACTATQSLPDTLMVPTPEQKLAEKTIQNTLFQSEDCTVRPRRAIAQVAAKQRGETFCDAVTFFPDNGDLYVVSHGVAAAPLLTNPQAQQTLEALTATLEKDGFALVEAADMVAQGRKSFEGSVMFNNGDVAVLRSEKYGRATGEYVLLSAPSLDLTPAVVDGQNVRVTFDKNARGQVTALETLPKSLAR